MSGSLGVSLSGSLAGFGLGFAAELARLGYARCSAQAQLRLMGHVSKWLASQGLGAGDLSAEVVKRFVVARRSRCRSMRSARALLPLVGFLRRAGVAPMPVPATPAGPVEEIIARFVEHLRAGRGLADATVVSYVSQAAVFLRWRVERYGADWASLTAMQVHEFVGVRARGQRPRSVQVGVNAVRALLRWMSTQGLVSAGLAESLGSVGGPAMAGLPKALTAAQVSGLFAALPAGGPVRLRNEAILMLLWRLGLRAGEVAGLLLEDVDWRSGVILVRGKGNRHEQVPLPADVGASLAAYLKEGRPAGGKHRQVFLAVDAPHRPVGSAAVSSMVARAAAGAGIPGPVHAHRLRHTAACQVLAGGGGLVEAGQLLRHASVAATAVYAKADVTALTVLARPWPGAGGAR
ncbi:MAG TPA: tyrosine-type recombinase/integrase [Micromonosporaceae bacterium]|nr:tyrosine-type recombinase/integrase [Micromonosporaceae bacterium]